MSLLFFFRFSLDYFVLVSFALDVFGLFSFSTTVRQGIGLEKRLRHDLFLCRVGLKTVTQSISTNEE